MERPVIKKGRSLTMKALDRCWLCSYHQFQAIACIWERLLSHGKAIKQDAKNCPNFQMMSAKCIWGLNLKKFNYQVESSLALTVFQQWILDSGVPGHISSNRSSFSFIYFPKIPMDTILIVLYIPIVLTI